MLIWLQLGSAICGLLGAVLWWLSAQRFFTQSKTATLESTIGGDGDRAYNLGDGMLTVDHHSRVALTNAWAAGLSGVAVLLQTVPVVFQLFGVAI
ncbi:hypothetical protein FHX08_004789 [Rhizobium sp. BK529]|nr:hypothetical protein [Rhizobium sp. BK529]